MAQSIDPIRAEIRLAQLLGEETATPAVSTMPAVGLTDQASGTTALSGNIFEDMLSKAVASLNNVSQAEIHANQMVESYVQGQADLQDVMVAQSKASIMMQFAITSVNSVVNTVKEVTQMQI